MNRLLWARYKAIRAQAKRIVSSVFTRGDIVALMQSFANVTSIPASDSAGQVNLDTQSIANAIDAAVGEVLTHDINKVITTVNGRAQEIENVQMVMKTVTRSIAAGITYAIVFGSGTVDANVIIKANSRTAKAVYGHGELAALFFHEAAARTAEVVHGHGYLTADASGYASPTEEEVQHSLLAVITYVTSHAGATTQEPESILLSSIAQSDSNASPKAEGPVNVSAANLARFIGYAGADTENHIVYVGGQLVARVITSAGAEIPTNDDTVDGYTPYVLLTAADGDDDTEYVVMLCVDANDHPIDNASNPVKHGDDEYIIHIT